MNENRNQILKIGSMGEEILVKGIVLPNELNAHFKAISVLLSTDQELDFVIERDAKGDELFNHIRELIRVRGYIREDQPGKWMIRITDYKVLEQNPEIARLQ